MSVIKKLFEIQKMNLIIKKDWKNPHFKNEYITLDKIVSVLQPICNEMNLLITHRTDDNKVQTFVYDIDLENEERRHRKYLDSCFPLWDVSNPQKVWSAITYAKRYNLCQIFNIITDRDDDWHKASLKEFTDEVFDKFKQTEKFSNASDAIKAIETKYTLTSEQKDAIWFYYETKWKNL